MKKILVLTLILSLSFLLTPLAALENGNSALPTTIVTDIPKADEIPAAKTFRVCETESGEVSEYSAEDYIVGVVAAEMPALYHEEALKAQAVAAYTYACIRKTENSQKSYDITTDPTTDQAFLTESELQDKWGDKAEEYIAKIKSCVKEVAGLMITHNGTPIVAVYHAISSGTTENSQDVWGKELPYLKSVASEGDKLATNYISQKEFTLEEIKKLFADELNTSDNRKDYFTDIKRTNTGLIKEISVCKEKLTGARVRSILDLKSTNFEVEYTEDKFKFTVYGYGHGVGMSQNGANFMAKQGHSYKEILTHYYTDCKIEKLE